MCSLSTPRDIRNDYYFFRLRSIAPAVFVFRTTQSHKLKTFGGHVYCPRRFRTFRRKGVKYVCMCVLFFTSVAFENVPFRPEGEGAYAVFFSFRAFGFIRAFIGLTVLILALSRRVCAFFSVQFEVF